MAGYPGTPLPKKLGIKAGHKVCLLNAPGSVQRHLDQDDVRLSFDLRLPLVDVVVLFVDNLEDLERRFGDAAARPVDWTMAAIVGTAGLKPVMAALAR